MLLYYQLSSPFQLKTSFGKQKIPPQIRKRRSFGRGMHAEPLPIRAHSFLLNYRAVIFIGTHAWPVFRPPHRAQDAEKNMRGATDYFF
jgi:hypothetical protein